MAALPGLLAATLAALAELLVLSGVDGPLGRLERSLQRITAAYVAGQAVLGLVLAILTEAATRAHVVPSPASWLAAGAITLAALGDGLIWRSRPRSGTSDITPDDRAATLLRLALAQAVGILGFALGFLALHFG